MSEIESPILAKFPAGIAIVDRNINIKIESLGLIRNM